MELRHLHYFMAVAEELHFGRAARRLHISQPPLSQQIRELEQELGVRLFERTSRSVRLTEAGSVFYQQAGQVFTQLERAVSLAQAVERGESGRLRVGFCAPAMEGTLPFGLREFGKRYPDVRLELLEARTPELLDALRRERIDVGFVRLYREQPDGLESELFFREPYLLAVPEGHRLDGAESVGLAQLDGEPLLLVPQQEHPKLYAAFLLAFENAGVQPRIVRQVAGKQTMAALTVAGEGLCFLPASMRSVARQGLRLLSIADALPQVEVFMAWHKGAASALVGRFVESLRPFRRDRLSMQNLTRSGASGTEL